LNSPKALELQPRKLSESLFISRILTDNGKEFTDRFCPTGERKPTGNHLFDQECAEHGIEHRLIKPRKPQTNGMVERFNGRIQEIVQQTRFESGPVA
jgi:transposase InsO family protein